MPSRLRSSSRRSQSSRDRNARERATPKDWCTFPSFRTAGQLMPVVPLVTAPAMGCRHPALAESTRVKPMISTFNAGWLRGCVDDDSQFPWKGNPTGARQRMSAIADVLKGIDTEVVNLVEVPPIPHSARTAPCPMRRHSPATTRVQRVLEEAAISCRVRFSLPTRGRGDGPQGRTSEPLLNGRLSKNGRGAYSTKETRHAKLPPSRRLH